MRRKVEEFGLKPPEWLTNSETYSFHTPWRHIRTGNWRFATHVPHSKEFLMALRANDMRGFPYMTFYQAPINSPYQGVRMSEHTDWIEIDEHGHWKRTGFWESEDSKNKYCTCANTEGYRESVLAYLRKLMEMGAGGIFLDNVHINYQCWGEKFGAHKHLYPTQIEAFTALLKDAQALIRKYDPEGALLINSSDPVTLPQEYWPWIDCEMSESYICTWVSTKRWRDWQTQWNGMDKALAKWMRRGKQVCCLSYVGHTRNKLKDDCYFCYASARLMNMIWNAGSEEALDDPECGILYQIETGQPVTEERVTEDGVHYRIFANGMVAVNPTNRAAKISISHGWQTSLLNDLYEHESVKVKWLDGKTGAVSVRIPAQSGRVFLCEPSDVPFAEPGVIAKPSVVKYVLNIETKPALGKTRFMVDGIPLMTYSGRWTTKYVRGGRYGTCNIDFDAPGKHRIEALDVERASLLVVGNYIEATRIDEQMEEDAAQLQPGDSPRLGKLMDPSNPTKFLEGAGYAFVGWEGDIKSKNPVIEVDIRKPVRLVARYRKI